MSNTRRFSNFETYPKQSTSISSANFNNFPTNFDQLDRKHYINSGPEYDYCSKSMPTSPRLFQLKRNSISTVESNESIFYLKERCLELELQLEKTRNQMLQMKTCYQNKILDMQRKMIELDDENLESKKNSIMLENDGNEMLEKLRIELEEEKQRRVEDAKQVEIKANQIKDWVLEKLRKLEEENRILTERNKELEKLHHEKNNDVLSRQESVEQEFEAVVESLKYLSSIVENDQKKNENVYVDICTPNIETKNNWNTNLKNRISNESESSETTATLANEILFLDDKPPTPPLHRCPSWEQKIYEIANESITEKSALLSNDRRQIHQNKIVEDIKLIGPNRNINIPVYATVKGRASQIRSVPFTGESTDDEEDDSSDYGLSNNDNLNNGNSNRNKIVSSSNFDMPSNCQIVSDPSFESGISDDYAIPPDAYSCSSSSTISGVIVAETYTSSMYATQQLQKQQSIVSLKSTKSQNSSFEKSGHLSKLGGKLKTWRKYWFSMSLNTNSKLLYWKNQQDSLKKHPHGTIAISTFTRINRGDAANFEIATDTKNYYLTADSVTAMEDWVRVLQNIQRKNATSMLLQNQEENQPLIQGWIKKVKNGRIKHCWCVLIGKMLLYFKNNNTTVPLGEIDLRDAKVEEIIQNSDSDGDEVAILESSSECPLESFNIGIFSSYGQSPTYLLFQSKHEYLNWLYHLTIVSGSGSSIGTQYEQLVQKLMECAGDNDSIVWRHPLLLYSKENIGSPLTSLNSEALQSEAVKLFKCCQLFMSVAVEQAGIDYHVILAQNALQQCLDVTDLQNELFCALIKQTSVYSSNNSTFTAKQITHEKNSTNYAKQSQQQQQQQQPETNFSLIQGWQLLALACSLFVPRNSRIVWYLKTHLVRNSNNKTECGKYATYCNRALQRTIKNGDRLMKPSRMEVLSLLLKNPFHHSLPHAIPVHMLNNSYQVTGFDGSTTIEEFLNTLSQEVGCRSSRENGFTLFSDDPLEKSIEHCLEPEAKLCDVISKWETALREKGMGKFENSRIIKLTYKNRLYWKQSTIKMETDREKQLICYQTNLQIVQGQFPVSRDLALEFASLMAQIDLGDFHLEKTKNKVFMRTILERFYPERYLEFSNDDFIRELEEKLQAKWTALKGRSILDCVRIYLTCARKWQFFGASLFETYSKQLINEKQTILSCWIAITESSVSILDFNSMNIIAEYTYDSIVTFGGCQNDFMLVVEDYSQRRQFSSNQSSSRKLLFSLPKPKILDITLLIADYMNALKQATLPFAGQHKRPKFIQELYLNIAAQQPDILKSVLDS